MDYWTCSVCDHENPYHHTRCEVCGAAGDINEIKRTEEQVRCAERKAVSMMRRYRLASKKRQRAVTRQIAIASICSAYLKLTKMIAVILICIAALGMFYMVRVAEFPGDVSVMLEAKETRLLEQLGKCSIAISGTGEKVSHIKDALSLLFETAVGNIEEVLDLL